jgi:TolB-like protein/DNA-binding winged helix-turn-helix (wHTH) protein/Flp pilus assembly protein TadD
MDDLQTHCTFRFGVFEVDTRTGEIRKQGRPVRLRGRPFDILVLLLESGGEAMTRDDLRHRLWPADTFVDFDHGLNSAMNRLREALGDSAENPRFIETLPKRGYRFIAPIVVVEAARPRTERAPSDASADPQRGGPEAVPAATPPVVSQTARPAVRARHRIVIAIGAAVVAVAAVAGAWIIGRNANLAASKMTLAVLPFQNLTADSTQEFFTDGFTEEMIAELGKLDPDRLGVIARTTTMLYKNAGKNIGQIKQDLGVDYVLEGSIRRSGNRVRITAQLIQTNDMTHLWAESYDRDVSDVLAIQSEVAMKIARSLTLALQRPRGERGPLTSASFSAYELCLRARFFREQATEEGARRAIEYFERAIAVDPGYAPAHAGIADAYRLLGAPGWEVEPPSTLLPKAKAAAERALALDMQSAEAHAVLAMVRFNYDWDLPGATREIEEAIRLNPNSAQSHQYYSSILTTTRNFERAIEEAHRALELDPRSPTAGTTLGIRYLYAGRPRAAIEQLTSTLEVNPGFAVAHWGLAQAYRAQGDARRGIEELTRAVELSGNSAYMRAHLAYALAVSGNRDRALSIRHDLEDESRSRYSSPYHVALIAAGLGDRAAALEALNRAVADRSGWLVFLPVQPEFDAMRAAPEFQHVLAKVRVSGE